MGRKIESGKDFLNSVCLFFGDPSRMNPFLDDTLLGD
jgi:hypothetical protein